MKCYQIDYNHIPDLPKCAACIGYFDGMHKGHQALMIRTKEIAKNLHISSAIITFDPDPWTIFYPDETFQHLFTIEDKCQYAQYMGFDSVYVLKFSKEFAALQVDEFHQVLERMSVCHLVCGFDFKYGQKNCGSIQTLQEQDLFDVSIIDSVNDNSIKISSSRIEPLICSGDMLEANTLFGFVYSISGTIVHGFKRGSSLLGFPTANLAPNPEYIIPMVGVYSGMAMIDDKLYGAMINIGKNPTFENKKLTIEANIFDWSEDLYGKKVRYYFLNFIRKEKKFHSPAELVEQLKQDIRQSKKDLQQYERLVRTTASIWQTQIYIQDIK